MIPRRRVTTIGQMRKVVPHYHISPFPPFSSIESPLLMSIEAHRWLMTAPQAPMVRANQPLPLALGHEISGRVVAAGEGAGAWLGKSVIVPAVLPCGECDLCRR